MKMQLRADRSAPTVAPCIPSGHGQGNIVANHIVIVARVRDRLLSIVLTSLIG
jgi:hypothetical protein